MLEITIAATTRKAVPIQIAAVKNIVHLLITNIFYHKNEERFHFLLLTFVVGHTSAYITSSHLLNHKASPEDRNHSKAHSSEFRKRRCNLSTSRSVKKRTTESYLETYATSLMKNVVYYQVEQFFHISPCE